MWTLEESVCVSVAFQNHGHWHVVITASSLVSAFAAEFEPGEPGICSPSAARALVKMKKTLVCCELIVNC